MNDMREIEARFLRPGMWILGRRDWHVKVEKVKFNPLGGNTHVEGVMRAGDEVKYRYRFGDKVWTWTETDER